MRRAIAAVTYTTLAEKALVTTEWPVQEVGGLSLIFSPLLSKETALTHAFTTRHGGTSETPLNWFNLGRHWNTDESKTDALKNRERLCGALGLDANRLTVPSQQHTSNIFVLEKGLQIGLSLPELDAVATDRVEDPILLHFADCVPVMIFDRHINALCVLHAGWRGTAGGIVTKGVQLLVERYGSKPSNIVAAVGPAIGSCCYETGDDVAQSLAATVKDASALIRTSKGKPHPDLKAINAMQLMEAGVDKVDVSAWCTSCHPEVFYSHRQSGGQTGRQGAIACLRQVAKDT